MHAVFKTICSSKCLIVRTRIFTRSKCVEERYCTLDLFSNVVIFCMQTFRSSVMIGIMTDLQTSLESLIPLCVAFLKLAQQRCSS